MLKKRNFLWIKHAKAHVDGALKNPLFIKPIKSKWRNILIIIGAIIVLVTSAIGVTYLPMFQVESMVINGASTLKVDDLSRVAWDALRQNPLPFVNETNFFLGARERITTALNNHFTLQSMSMVRSGNLVTITIQEKVMTIALRTKEKTAFLDLAGKYIRDATADESHAIDVAIGTAQPAESENLAPLQPNMPIIINTQNEATTELSTSTANQIMYFSDKLNEQGIHPLTFTIDGLNAPDAKIHTDKFDILVDLNSSVDDQIRSLNAVLSQHTVIPSSYIDIRFGAYVYIK